MRGMQLALDITELTRARTELEDRLAELAGTNEELERYIASNLELEQFAYIASHDLKEPIRTIISFSQLLELKFREVIDPEAKDYITYIIDGARRMQALIEGLLDYSRVDHEGRPFERIDMDRLMETVLRNLHAPIADRQVEVIYDDLPPVDGDSVQLGQLLQNLISNGIKFNDKDRPEIRVTAELLRDDWWFSVSDNGIGMDPENTGRIFGIFRRLHTRDEYEGAGIGLAVCKKIVERHGGRLQVESEPGKGTTFRFCIPRRIRKDRRA